MTARDTYAASIAGAQSTNIAANIAALALAQETVNLAGNATVALCSGSGNATVVSKTKTAAATLVASENANAVAANATVDGAKNTLRAGGDVAPF